jgi:hypothetical protein
VQEFDYIVVGAGEDDATYAEFEKATPDELLAERRARRNPNPPRRRTGL